MASRSRRFVPRGTRGRARRSRGPAPDWVYNAEGYSGVSEALAPGPTNIQAVSLVNSLNTQRMLQFGQVDFLGTNTANAAAIDVAGSWERPGGRRDRLHAFQGTYICTPDTWSTVSVFNICMRLIVLEQDALTGAAILPSAFYSTWIESPATGNPTAKWANEARVLHEWRFGKSFDSATTSPQWYFYLWCRMKWRLRPEDGLFLLLEGPTGNSINTRYRLFSRVLMSGDRG